MLFSRRAALTAAAAFLSYYSFAQQAMQNAPVTFDTRLQSSLQTYFKKYPQEKLFAHLNQDAYSSGETLWYKIYAMAYGKPSALSGVVYVQLTDTAGNLISQNKLPLVDGKAHGNIDIDPKLKTGWYKLSAFTSWMMNFDHESYFNQKIYIRDSSAPGAVTDAKEVIESNYHIIFFPEGGDLIDGSIARVAFKAFSEDGLPAKIEGVVKDKGNKVIANLVTVHDGMGEFSMEPAAGVSYSANVKFPDGSSQVVQLPATKTEGASIRSSQVQDAVKLSIALAATKKQNENCLLVAVQNSGVVNTYPLQLSNGFNEFNLPKTSFSTGVLRLTLFNDEGLPVSERLVFINKHDLKFSALAADTLSFSPNGHNSFSIAIKDKANQPVKGNFSIAVTDGNAFSDAISQNIYSALLLSPELKGEVYNPGYYFKNESDSLAQQLDLVMLTNGWRHFSWQRILNNENDVITHAVEHSTYIAGKVLDYSTLQSDDRLKVKLMIFNHDSTKFVGYAMPDTSGSFILKDFNHQGIADLYIQTVDKKGHNRGRKVKLYSMPGDSLARLKADAFTEQGLPELTGYFIAHSEAEAKNREFGSTVTLKTVNVRAKKITPTEKRITEHVSPEHRVDHEFTLDLVNNPTVNIGIINYIKGKFPGLLVVGDSNRPQFLYHGGNSLEGAPGTLSPSAAQQQSDMSQDNHFLPYFYLNDAPVEYMAVKDFSLDDIALITFIPPPVWFAPYNGGNAGALMIYTKRQSDELKEVTGISATYDHFIFNGYSITREFAPPDYGKIKQSGLLDDRITIYWNHDIETDANGVVKFKFYNTDIAKKFRIVIQGMDSNGGLLYIQKEFQQK